MGLAIYLIIVGVLFIALFTLVGNLAVQLTGGSFLVLALVYGFIRLSQQMRKR